MPQLNSGFDRENHPGTAPAKDALEKTYNVVSSTPANLAKLADPTGLGSVGAGVVEVTEGVRRVADGRAKESVAPFTHGALDLVAGIPLLGKLSAVGKVAKGASSIATVGQGAETARAVTPAGKFLGTLVPAVTGLLPTVTRSLADQISAPKNEGSDLGSRMRDSVRADLFKAEARVREARNPVPGATEKPLSEFFAVSKKNSSFLWEGETERISPSRNVTPVVEACEDARGNYRPGLLVTDADGRTQQVEWHRNTPSLREALEDATNLVKDIRPQSATSVNWPPSTDGSSEK